MASSGASKTTSQQRAPAAAAGRTNTRNKAVSLMTAEQQIAAASLPSSSGAAAAASSVSSATTSTTVASRQLGGHRDSVLCVQAGRGVDTQHLLLSGSEDSSARLWDLRTNRAVRCIRAFDKNPVSSVRFGSWHGSECAYTVYAAAGQMVCEFDLRADAAVIINRTSTSLRAATDDINQISISSSGLWAVCCDDSGDARILGVEHAEAAPLASQSLPSSTLLTTAAASVTPSSSSLSTCSSSSSSTTPVPAPAPSTPSVASSPSTTTHPSSTPVSDLRLLKSIRAHENICSSASFRPRAAGQLATGGMDSSIAIWDYTRGKLLTRLSTSPPPGSTPSGQMFNPPFIHSIDFSADGSLLASGLGSSEVCLFNVPLGDTSAAATAKECGRLRGHHAAVAVVEWCPLGNGSDWLVSGGNDRCLLLWDIQSAVSAFQHHELASRSAAARKKLRKKGKGPTSGISKADTKSSDETKTKSTSSTSSSTTMNGSTMINGVTTIHPRHNDMLQAAFSTDELPLLDGYQYVRQRILHAAKPNWITTSPNGWMYVADPSENITCYSLV